MPNLSEVSKNAKKIKEQIAEQAGVSTKELNDANLKEVGKALEGAGQVASAGQNPTQIPIEKLKELGSGEKDQSSAEQKTNQQKIAMAIAAIAPALIGYAAGGEEGGAIGAQQGVGAIGAFQKAEADKNKYDLDLSAKKELKQMEITKDMKLAQERAEDRKAQYAAGAEGRELTNMLKREQIAKGQKEAELKGSFEGRIQKLGAEGKQRLDNARMGLVAVQGMNDALNMGQNTFSVWGDNDFTQQRALFEEALGRMQSGGAISKEEEARFKNMAPTFRDTPEMKQKKLANIQSEMLSRIQTLGFKPEELGVKVADFAVVPKSQDGSPLNNNANAAPAAPDFDNMSEEELKKYLGK